MIVVGQGSLRRAVAEYTTHYHAERNHQGLENRLIVPTAVEAADGKIHCYARLGGTLNYYYRARHDAVVRKFGHYASGPAPQPSTKPALQPG